MTEENKSVKNFPNLRFPGFEEDWAEKILTDLGTFSGGGTPTSSNEKFWNGNIPWISSSDLEEDNILKINITRFITQDAIEKSSTKLCKAPSVLIVSRVGVGKVALSLNDICTSQDFTNISELKCNQLYLAFQLSKVMKKAANEVQGTSIKGISSSEIKSKKIYLPSIVEQEKISSFLEKIDKRIQTQKKIIEQLETLMNVSREKIFSQKLRFKNEQGNYFPDWKLYKLSNLGMFFSGGTPLTSNRNYYKGNIPFIKSGEINAIKTEQFISEEALKNSSAKMVNVGDILYAMYGATSGEVGICKINGAINQAILCIRTELNSLFLLNYLKLKKDNILNTYLQGGQGNLSSEIIKSLYIPVPDSAEQIKIANFLSSIQNKIETEKQILERLELQKKFLLANLFV